MLMLVFPALAAEPLLMPLTEVPWVDPSPVTAAVSGGLVFEGASTIGGGVRVDANIAERVNIQAQASLSSAAEEPVLAGGVRVAVLGEADQGVDLGIGTRYKREGFGESEAGGEAELGEVEGVIALGRIVGETSLLGNVVVGTGLNGRERDAELTLAAMNHTGDTLAVGVEGRIRGGVVERDGVDAEAVDLVLGPVVNACVGPVRAMMQVGGSGSSVGGWHVGLAASAGARFEF